MSEAWKDAYAAGIFTEFMEQRGPGHTVGSEQIYKKGFQDYKNDIIEARNRLDFLNDKEAFDKKAQLNAMEICCDAIMILGERYAAYARELAEKETDETVSYTHRDVYKRQCLHCKNKERFAKNDAKRMF